MGSSSRRQCGGEIHQGLAGVFCDLDLAFEHEDDEVVREVSLHYGFSKIKREVADTGYVVVVVIDQFSAAVVGYETVVLHKTCYVLKNIFVFATV